LFQSQKGERYVHTALKIFAIIAILALLTIMWERWYEIYFMGRLYAHYGIGSNIFGFGLPVATTVFGVLGAVRIIKF